MKARTKEVTHRIMTSIKAKDTKPEKTFRKRLWSEKIRYRKNVDIFGKPDIAIKKYKLAIFIDGDFWHGNNWKIRGLNSLEEEIAAYSEFWKKKILRNIERDKDVNRFLQKNGWIVLRFWQSEIELQLDKCIQKTIETIKYIKKDI